MKRANVMAAELKACQMRDALVLEVLRDVKKLWDVAGLGDDPWVSEDVYKRMLAAISQLEKTK